MSNLLLYVLYYYVVINIVSFAVMYYDKRQAIENNYRVSEKTLFTLALALGGVGIYLGMILFRHKTKHLSFRVMIPIIVIINFIVMIYIFLKFI